MPRRAREWRRARRFGRGAILRRGPSRVKQRRDSARRGVDRPGIQPEFIQHPARPLDESLELNSTSRKGDERPLLAAASNQINITKQNPLSAPGSSTALDKTGSIRYNAR